ncbi:MAG TPA: bifunctional YncE family protein/alkaline phosphatase family protein, partial [Chitinophagales bacterium]|nr:bifunctional YncE family protein/alkaline phosphatase family protein [Chitinophagales bacterium]
DTKTSDLLDAVWDGKQAQMWFTFEFKPQAPAPLALPNDIAITNEGGETYLYVVLNGNNQLVKIRYSDKKVIGSEPTGMAPFGIAIAAGKIYVTNWAGPVPTDTLLETAGIPYGEVYINHRTGGTSCGTVSVIDLKTGITEKEIPVALHPNAIIKSPDEKYIYVANGNSDEVSVISTATNTVCDSISVKLSKENNPYIGSSPNALALDKTGEKLYVANGMDNALAVIKLGALSGGKAGDDKLLGFIPTEAYPAGIALDDKNLYVCNLEGEGARVNIKGSYNAHHQEATVSIIPVPDEKELPALTARVEKADMLFRTKLAQLLPRDNIKPQPVPERIGEPSLIKHVIYIIKENRTYDQVMGDVPTGNGDKSLCIYGDSVTPNQHRLVKQFELLDNYYASGKSSAEGHQWTDAAMTSDYVEKNVRAWFRSYPHVQNDALVYNREGFIWNNALDHGKTVRIYGEACEPEWDRKLGWKDIYKMYKAGELVQFNNETTISRVRPVLCMNSPCADTHDFSDVMRADAFIKELHQYEKMEGDQWPQLMVMALSDDHTAGLNPKYPTPRAMVADNDMAVGKIVEAVSHSRFWKSTAIFITEDDSQDGWDHVSAYRTTGYVISPYSQLHKTIHTNYNQTCIVRTIEQILGLPPMNVIDATALPMFDCFQNKPDTTTYSKVANIIPLDEMNKDESMLKGKELDYAVQSSAPEYEYVDRGNDDLLNRVLWFAAKGNEPYPTAMTIRKKKRGKDDD